MRLSFHSKHIALLALTSFTSLIGLTACFDDDEYIKQSTDNNLANFEACWKAMDEHYCFFTDKGVDWDSVYKAYRPWFADSSLNMIASFNKLGDMLAEVKDGHVNLSSPFNTARYWSWFESYPYNFDENLLEQYYLGTKYWTAGGLRFGLMRDSVGYIYYPSFSNSPSESNVDYMLAALSRAKGLIFDIRNNGGGALTNVPRIANRFATEKTTYGYMMHKKGTGHDDFSDPEPLYLEPQDGRITWDASKAPVIILTNRHCYSAANNFVSAMKSLDGDKGKMIKTIGDRTGGGGGMPLSTILPIGWTLRFSACPILDHKMRQTEAGIDPDFRVDMDSVNMWEHHRDDIIEAAREYINKNTKVYYTKQEK